METYWSTEEVLTLFFFSSQAPIISKTKGRGYFYKWRTGDVKLYIWSSHGQCSFADQPGRSLHGITSSYNDPGRGYFYRLRIIDVKLCIWWSNDEQCGFSDPPGRSLQGLTSSHDSPVTIPNHRCDNKNRLWLHLFLWWKGIIRNCGNSILLLLPHRSLPAGLKIISFRTYLYFT